MLSLGSAPAGLRRGLVAVLLFGATLGLAGHSLSQRRQLGYLGGLSDRWLELGLHLSERSIFGVEGQPTVYKAPGYAFFEAGVLRLAGVRPERRHAAAPPGPGSDLAWLSLPYDAGELEHAAACIYSAQAVLLAGATAALFLWLSSWMRAGFAFAAAALLGLNPYSLVLVGLVHYSLLTLFLGVVGAWAVDAGTRARQGAPGRLAWAGALWGLGALVRSVTLATVPLLLALAWRRAPTRRQAVLRSAALCAGLGAALLPWTLRNRVVCGAWVPVNAQFWSAFFGSTARAMPAMPDHFRWKLVRAEVMQVEALVEGPRARGWEPFSVRENLVLEGLYRQACLRNLRQQPAVYLFNVRESWRSFHLDLNVGLVRVFQHMQRPGLRWRTWFHPGTPERGQRRTEAEALRRGHDLLVGLASLGLMLAAWRRDGAVLVPLAVYLSLAGVHALVWMDFMYYCVKLPWLLVGAAYALDRLAALGAGRWRTASVLGAGAAATLLVLGVLELSRRVFF